MNRNFNFGYGLRRKCDLILPLGIYLVLSLVMFKFYIYNTGVDGICYISIAEKYANGNISNAINGYWSPLFSWLLTLFLIKGHTPLSALISSKILSLIIGFFTLLGMHWLSYRFNMNRTIRILFTFSLVPVILCFALTELTSDLLMCCALVYCFIFLMDPNYPNHYINGLMCGLFGALAYLSKSFAFPFFLVIFVLFSLIYYFKKFKADKNIIKNLALGLLVFFLISGSWMLILDKKYGELTIGTSGKYNYDALGPDIQLNHPMNIYGQVKPPDSSAVSGWEDPSYVKLKSWSPFESWSNFCYQLSIIGKNILELILVMLWFSPIMLLVILLGFVTAFRSSDETFKLEVMSLLVIITVFILGYLPYFIQARYFYLVYLLSFILGCLILNSLIQRKDFNKINKRLLLFIFFFLFVILPSITLIYHANSYNGIYELSETLKNNYNVHGNIASDSEAKTSLYLTYFLESSYYMAIDTNESDLESKLDENNIDYYLVWDTNKKINLNHYKEINNPKSTYPRVFKRIVK